jgi:hypothetical protein
MNEKERVFRTMITPALKELAKLCRLNENAFVTIVEIEPGKVIQISYLPDKSTLKQTLTKLHAKGGNEPFTTSLVNEEKTNIARTIRAERG